MAATTHYPVLQQRTLLLSMYCGHICLVKEPINQAVIIFRLDNQPIHYNNSYKWINFHQHTLLMFKNIIIVLLCPPALKDEQSANRQQQPPSEFQTKPNNLIITLLGEVYPSPSTKCWDALLFSGSIRPLNDFKDIKNSK